MVKSNETSPEIDALKEDLATLKKHMSELTASLKQDGVDEAGRISSKAKEKLGDLKDRGSQGLETVENKVREKPGQSIAVAFAAGFLASLLLRNRS